MGDSAPRGGTGDADAILLIEVDGNPVVVEDEKAKVLEVLKANNAREVTLAKSAEHKAQLWTARRMALPCLAKLRPTTFVEDATIPRSKIPDFLRIVTKASKDHNVTIGTFGHAGDGNMHPTIVCDLRDEGSNVTLISALLPGATGSLGHSGVVQPQEAITRVITNGMSPALVMAKVCDTFPSASLMTPKL